MSFERQKYCVPLLAKAFQILTRSGKMQKNFIAESTQKEEDSFFPVIFVIRISSRQVLALPDYVTSRFCSAQRGNICYTTMKKFEKTTYVDVYYVFNDV